MNHGLGRCSSASCLTGGAIDRYQLIDRRVAACRTATRRFPVAAAGAAAGGASVREASVLEASVLENDRTGALGGPVRRQQRGGVMSVIRVGSNGTYADGWDKVFGGTKGKAARPGTKKKSAKKKAGAKAAKKAKKPTAKKKPRGR